MNETNWKPPEVAMGEEVLYYPSGDVMAQAVIARVVECDGRCVTLQVCFGRGVALETKAEVLHWSDPWLESKSWRRREGCWQESPMRTQIAYLQRANAAMAKRLQKLEEALEITPEDAELTTA
jgi:hypothetical protein